ncbi:MAG: peptidylprolyl isomerase [Candidatus Pristimantibacillus lignocellulolyticus]|uniref:Peptidylprolyl isomerase n=1 Tax=Candidatus Pristimantibacillus lignocellulolyticus TaxID=2994561 RepID=A0A9J6ZGD9_9BACL|nr:MAG: peptidylprolyl isomerase [Candidatus Pristimantibacillus lignocellulolyticus]
MNNYEPFYSNGPPIYPPPPKTQSNGWMISTIILGCLLIMAFLTIIFLLIGLGIASESDQSPVAIVNKVEISESKLLDSLIDSSPDLLIDEIDYLIESEIIKQEAAKQGIKLTDQDLHDQLAASKVDYGSEEEFQDYLNYYEMTTDDYKNTLVLPTLTRLLLEHEISVTDEEISAYFEQNKNKIGQSPERVRASLITVDDLDSANQILTELNNGASFLKLANQYSTDYSAEDGGDLGYFTYDEMDVEISEVAFALDINELSDVVPTYYGYSIILKTEYISAIPAQFTDVQRGIEIKLINDKIYSDYSTYIDDLIFQSDVWSIVDYGEDDYDYEEPFSNPVINL